MNFYTAIAILICASSFSTKAYAEDSIWNRAFPEKTSVTLAERNLAIGIIETGTGLAAAAITSGTGSLRGMLINERASLAVTAADARLNISGLRNQLRDIQAELSDELNELNELERHVARAQQANTQSQPISNLRLQRID